MKLNDYEKKIRKNWLLSFIILILIYFYHTLLSVISCSFNMASSRLLAASFDFISLLSFGVIYYNAYVKYGIKLLTLNLFLIPITHITQTIFFWSYSKTPIFDIINSMHTVAHSGNLFISFLIGLVFYSYLISFYLFIGFFWINCYRLRKINKRLTKAYYDELINSDQL